MVFNRFLSKVKSNQKILLNLLLIFLIYQFIIYSLIFLTTYHNLNAPLPDFSLTASLIRWDSFHYLEIASEGYVYPNMVLFPLYPLMMRLVNFFIGNVILSGFLISWLSLFLAMFFLFKLVLLKFKNKDLAYLSVIFLLLFPFAIFYSTLYAEALFLFLTLGAFYFFEKKKWPLVGLFSLLAGATRIFGILLFIVFLLAHLFEKRFNLKKIDKNLFFICLAPLGLIFYMIFLQIKFDDLWIFLRAQKEWGTWTQFSAPWKSLFYHLRILFDFNLLKNISVETYFQFFRDFLFWPIFAICSIFVVKAIGWPYALYNFLTLFVITFRFPMTSANKHIMLLFPVYILLALWSKNQVVRFLVLLLFAFLFFFYTTLFIKGNFIG